MPQAQPMPQQGMPAPQGGVGGFMNGVQSFLGNHQNAMMGLGAGIASGGLQRGVPMMTQGNQQDYQRQMQMGQLNATYQARNQPASLSLWHARQRSIPPS